MPSHFLVDPEKLRIQLGFESKTFCYLCMCTCASIFYYRLHLTVFFLFMIALQCVFSTGPGNYGVVTIVKGGLVCVTCKDGKECQHILLILSLKDSDYPSSLDVIFSNLDSIGASQLTQSLRLVGVSKSTITFKPDRELQMIFKKCGIQNCVQLSDKGEVLLQCPIDNSECLQCRCEWSLQYQKLNLVTETTILLAHGMLLD